MTKSLKNNYKNLNGISIIRSYETGDDFIKVALRDSGMVYKCSHRTAGKAHVEKMKELAVAGSGLGKYFRDCIRLK